MIEPLLSLYWAARAPPKSKTLSLPLSNLSHRPERHRRRQQQLEKLSQTLYISFLEIRGWNCWHNDHCETVANSSMGEMMPGICEICDIWWNYCSKIVKILKGLWYTEIYRSGLPCQPVGHVWVNLIRPVNSWLGYKSRVTRSTKYDPTRTRPICHPKCMWVWCCWVIQLAYVDRYLNCFSSHYSFQKEHQTYNPPNIA